MRRSHHLGGFAMAVLVMASWGFISHRPVQATQENRTPVKIDRAAALVEKKQQLCLRILGLIQKARKLGAPVTAYSQQVINWSRQLLETQIYLSLADSDFKTQDIEVYLSRAKGPANADRVAAFEGYLRTMKGLEDIYRPLYDKGNYSTYDFAQIEAVRVQAEIWLAREQGR